MSDTFGVGLGDSSYTQNPSLLDTGPSSGGASDGLSIGGALDYLDNSLGTDFSSGGSLDSSSGGGNGVWGDINNVINDLGKVNDIIGPYIMTQKQQMELNIQRLLAEAKLAQAKAEEKNAETGNRKSSIQIQPLTKAMPPWILVAVLGVGVLVLILLLKE
jgi:hypothetical protein